MNITEKKYDELLKNELSRTGKDSLPKYEIEYKNRLFNRSEIFDHAYKIDINDIPFFLVYNSAKNIMLLDNDKCSVVSTIGNEIPFSSKDMIKKIVKLNKIKDKEEIDKIYMINLNSKKIKKSKKHDHS